MCCKYRLILEKLRIFKITLQLFTDGFCKYDADLLEIHTFDLHRCWTMCNLIVPECKYYVYYRDSQTCLLYDDVLYDCGVIRGPALPNITEACQE